MSAAASTPNSILITGAGAAGLSLAVGLAQCPALSQCRILLLDQERREAANDRTWCFWEDRPGPFEAIVAHRWQQLWVHQGQFSRLMDIAPYTYKIIRSAQFYRHANAILDAAPNVERRYGRVSAVGTAQGRAYAILEGRKWYADYGFNSIPFTPVDKSNCHYLDQHFRGWFIRTPHDAFQPGQATLMDYRTPQQGETRFLYVLPVSAREALVEVAIFSNNHLKPEAYDHIMRQYLLDHWPQAHPYEVVEVEQGNIPMTDFPFSRGQDRIVHLGMAGGDTRASSGYTFWYIQQRVAAIVDALQNGRHPLVPETFIQRRHRSYDSLLLKVLQRGYYPGDAFFGQLFAQNPPARVLAFLNGQTTLWQEIQLMQTAPIPQFLRALLPG